MTRSQMASAVAELCWTTAVNDPADMLGLDQRAAHVLVELVRRVTVIPDPAGLPHVLDADEWNKTLQAALAELLAADPTYPRPFNIDPPTAE
jgi:hypothetical protein